VSNIATIHKTSDLNQFKLLKANRTINEDHVKSLARSLEENNLLAVNPIIVDDNLQVIDGQHRLAAAKRLGIPVYYVVIRADELKSEDAIRKLNAYQRTWTFVDFAKSWANKGKEDYKVLIAFSEGSGMTYPLAAALLGGNSGKQRTLFRRGDFKARDIEFATRVAEKWRVMKEYVPENARNRGAFLSALTHIVRNFPDLDWKRMEDKAKELRAKGNTYPVSGDVFTKDWLRSLEDLYNHKLGENSAMRVRFY